MSSLLLDALRCENRGRPPIWLMRQAGRHLEAYRNLRAKYSFLELCHHPELIAVFLNEYLGVAVPVIHEYGGIVDKFIGDGILAYFGFKERDGEDGTAGASSAILAALKLKESFLVFKQNWLDIWKTVTNLDINIDVKCGINTGSVLVGLMGSEERDQFTVIGTHVNLASRLEGIAEGDQIVMSQYTKERVLEKFNFETTGIKEKIKAFEDITEYYIVKSQK